MKKAIQLLTGRSAGSSQGGHKRSASSVLASTSCSKRLLLDHDVTTATSSRSPGVVVS